LTRSREQTTRPQESGPQGRVRRHAGWRFSRAGKQAQRSAPILGTRTHRRAGGGGRTIAQEASRIDYRRPHGRWGRMRGPMTALMSAAAGPRGQDGPQCQRTEPTPGMASSHPLSALAVVASSRSAQPGNAISSKQSGFGADFSARSCREHTLLAGDQKLAGQLPRDIRPADPPAEGRSPTALYRITNRSPSPPDFRARPGARGPAC